MNRKMFLYVAVAFLCFSLWNLWHKDYGTHQEVPQVVTKPVVTVAQETIDPSRLIKVRTDVLDVAIDTVGGNIVAADLLQYDAAFQGNQPVRLLNYTPQQWYVAKSSLLSTIGPDLPNQAAIYTAESNNYVLGPEQDTLTVKLTWRNEQGLTVHKVFTFTRQQYNIAVNYTVRNNLREPWSGRFNAQLQRKHSGEKAGLFKLNTYSGAALSSSHTPYEKISYSAMQKADVQRETTGGWAALQQRYFLSAWIPNASKVYQYFSRFQDGMYTIGMQDNELHVAPGGSLTVAANLYIGPEIAENLKPLAKGLELTADYGWLWVISIALFWLLKKVHLLVGNWGWSIVVVTVLIKLLFFKPSEKSYRSMAKMKELAPKLQRLKELYGDDKQKLQQATVELYKQERINPLGGCLPMLIQIPFFIALYYVLMGAIELRHAPFMLWIQDLSTRDPYFILPILMGFSMILQQKLSPTTADPQQAKVMMLMPILFTVFFMSFPAGLVLYWLVNNCLSILQQWYISRSN